MKTPPLKLIHEIGGSKTWKCAACYEPFDLRPYTGTPEERFAQMTAAYEKHFKDRHSHEDASQAAARIVREATERD
jgi:hypothetical protein